MLLLLLLLGWKVVDVSAFRPASHLCHHFFSLSSNCYCCCVLHKICCCNVNIFYADFFLRCPAATVSISICIMYISYLFTSMEFIWFVLCFHESESDRPTKKNPSSSQRVFTFFLSFYSHLVNKSFAWNFNNNNRAHIYAGMFLAGYNRCCLLLCEFSLQFRQNNAFNVLI